MDHGPHCASTPEMRPRPPRRQAATAAEAATLAGRASYPSAEASRRLRHGPRSFVHSKPWHAFQPASPPAHPPTHQPARPPAHPPASQPASMCLPAWPLASLRQVACLCGGPGRRSAPRSLVSGDFQDVCRGCMRSGWRRSVAIRPRCLDARRCVGHRRHRAALRRPLPLPPAPRSNQSQHCLNSTCESRRRDCRASFWRPRVASRRTGIREKKSRRRISAGAGAGAVAGAGGVGAGGSA